MFIKYAAANVSTHSDSEGEACSRLILYAAD